MNELSASILDEVTEDWEDDETDGLENSGIPANTSTPITIHSGNSNFFVIYLNIIFNPIMFF